MDFCFKRSYRGKLKAVVLDWAGTIVDYGCMAPVEAFLQVFGNKGLLVTTEEIRSFMGTHKRDHLRSIMSLKRVNGLWHEVHKRTFTENDVRELFEQFLPHQLAALATHSRLIAGALDTIECFKERQLKICTTTGYTRQMMEVVVDCAKKQGFEADNVVCSDDVPMGRPSPFMCFENAKKFGIYPMESMVKIGDTPADIEEGLNASMWTVGLARSGNEYGLSEEEDQKLTASAIAKRLLSARNNLIAAGAHYVVDSIGDARAIIDDINHRLSLGERP